MRWPFVKRSTYNDVCEAAREHNLRANRAESERERQARHSAELLHVAGAAASEARKSAEAWRAAHAVVLDRFLSYISGGPVRSDTPVPDPPSVGANDEKVAVALRDREAAPLKRAMRPGEEE